MHRKCVDLSFFGIDFVFIGFVCVLCMLVSCSQLGIVPMRHRSKLVGFVCDIRDSRIVKGRNVIARGSVCNSKHPLEYEMIYFAAISLVNEHYYYSITATKN